METRDYTNDTISLVDRLYAMQQRNLVYNFNFLYFSNQEVTSQQMIQYNHPDGWVYKTEDSGGSITFNVANNCCRIVKSPSNKSMRFYQAVHEFPRWKQVLCEQLVSAALLISTPSGVSNQVTLSLDDGVNISSRSVMLNPNEKTVVTVNLMVSDVATKLLVIIESTSPSATFDIYEVYANKGRLPLNTLTPMVQGYIGERKQYVATETAPVTEMSLCREASELSGEYTRLNSVLNGMFGVGQNGNSMLPDMRGYFSRSWNNQGTIDQDAKDRKPLGTGAVSGDHVGTTEPDSFLKHVHPLAFSTLGAAMPASGSASVPTISLDQQDNTQGTGGKETRGINVAELYTIKWA